VDIDVLFYFVVDDVFGVFECGGCVGVFFVGFEDCVEDCGVL